MSSYITSGSRSRASKRDHRKAMLAFSLVAILVLGYLISLVPGKGISADSVVQKQTRDDAFADLQPISSTKQPIVEQEAVSPVAEQQLSPQQDAIRAVLALAQAELNGERYDLAIATLQVARQQLKQEPKAYLLMGQALQGKKDHNIARDFYNKALDIDPLLAAAYWGFAQTSEELGDLEAALGAMRNFLHVQPGVDSQQLKIAQARSAIWEWESQLGRGPWGPTKGIPPGFSAEELKRDGRGVATKMPLLETKNPDGMMKYEIKHADKIKIFKSEQE